MLLTSLGEVVDEGEDRTASKIDSSAPVADCRVTVGVVVPVVGGNEVDIFVGGRSSLADGEPLSL